MAINLIPIDQLASSEEKEAKDYWSTTKSMGLGYGNKPPDYAKIVARTIVDLSPKTVFEFGCNAGRNLLLVRDLNQSIHLSGIDINQDSIEFGKKNNRLDLTAGDETYLQQLDDNQVDLVFTVSVLDHVPDFKSIAKELIRISKKNLVLFEPYIEGKSGKIANDTNLQDAPSTKNTVIAYSYLHDYLELQDEARLISKKTIQVKPGGLGPYYTLMIFETT